MKVRNVFDAGRKGGVPVRGMKTSRCQIPLAAGRTGRSLFERKRPDHQIRRSKISHSTPKRNPGVTSGASKQDERRVPDRGIGVISAAHGRCFRPGGDGGWAVRPSFGAVDHNLIETGPCALKKSGTPYSLCRPSHHRRFSAMKGGDLDFFPARLADAPEDGSPAGGSA